MPQNFIECRRDQAFLMPSDLRDWLPGDHLVWTVVDAVEALDLAAFYGDYRSDGHGRAAYDPSMMVALLLYAYARGQRSSRVIERECLEDIAFRVIAVNERPDHSTIARFIARHEDALAGEGRVDRESLRVDRDQQIAVHVDESVRGHGGGDRRPKQALRSRLVEQIDPVHELRLGHRQSLGEYARQVEMLSRARPASLAEHGIDGAIAWAAVGKRAHRFNEIDQLLARHLAEIVTSGSAVMVPPRSVWRDAWVSLGW
jgi:transposase